MLTVFDFLAEVEQRPEMYFSRLRDLESTLHGYCAALSHHSIDEGVPHMLHFAEWLRRETGWSMSCGWSAAFDEHVPHDEHTRRLFGFMARFKTLRPATVASVDLEDRHQPTGKRVVIGFDGRVERPDRIEIVRYQPEPLHYMRFSYPTHTEVARILMVNRPNGTLDAETDLDDAKGWVAAEFQVEAQDWN